MVPGWGGAAGVDRGTGQCLLSIQNLGQDMGWQGVGHLVGGVELLGDQQGPNRQGPRAGGGRGPRSRQPIRAAAPRAVPASVSLTRPRLRRATGLGGQMDQRVQDARG